MDAKEEDEVGGRESRGMGDNGEEGPENSFGEEEEGLSCCNEAKCEVLLVVGE